MTKRRILLQLDPDKHASVFDRVVAVDAGVEEVFAYGGVAPDEVTSLVHGAIFTRGPKDLHHTAIFVGGSNVSRAEEILATVKRTFFGPMRCSVLMDANGANTTAAAAVLCATAHMELRTCKALVLGGTGPVGERVALMLALQGAAVWVGSRNEARANDVCERIRERVDGAHLRPVGVASADAVSRHPERFHLILAAGAAGVRILEADHLEGHDQRRVLVDLNAVPPSGIEGVEITDAGREVDGVFHYGALGVGKLKMKLHKAAIAHLFEANDRVLDAAEVLALGKQLTAAAK